MKPQNYSTPGVAFKNCISGLLICFCLAIFNSAAIAQVEFTVDFDNGCAPLTVNATNISHTYWDTTNASFYWFIDYPAVSDTADTTYNFSNTYTTPGNYNLRVIGYDQFSVYQGEWSRNISVGGAAPFQPADSSEFCPGASINFNYNNVYNSLEWDFGDTTPTAMWNYVQHTYADTGTYTVRLVVNDVCGNDTIYQTIKIYNTAVPVPNPSTNVMNVCVGDAVEFNAGGLQDTYAWDFDDTNTDTVENPSHAYADTGNYMIELTVTNICGQSGTDSVSLRVDTGLVPNAFIGGSPNNCPNELIMFNAQDPGSYLWDFGNGMTDTVKNPSTYYADTGSYIVQLIINNGCGKSDTDTTTITIAYSGMGNMGSAQIEFADGGNMGPPSDTDSVCIGDPVRFRNNSWSGSQLTWKWYYGDGDSSSLRDPAPHSYSTNGTYEVQLIRYNGCGGSDTARKWVVVDANVTPSWAGMWTPMSICPGEIVLFMDFDLEDDPYVYTYNVYYGDGNSSGPLSAPSDPDMEFPIDSHLYNVIGNYEVIFTATNGCGITDSVIYSVYVNNPNTMPNYFYGNSSNEGGGMGGPSGMCPGDTVEFYLIAANDVAWDYGDASTDSTGYHVYASTGTYYTTGFVENACGGVDTILDTAYINLSNMPGGQAEASDNFGCIGDTIWFTRGNWGGGGGDGDQPQNEQFLWYFGDGDSATTEEAYHVYSTGGVYNITYSITNGCGTMVDNWLTVIIDAPILDESGVTVIDASCGGSDGSLSTLFVLSPGQFTYSWKNASETEVSPFLTATSLPAGVYTLTVTNQNGCTAMSSPYAVVEVGAPVAPTAPSPPDYCQGDAIADLTASGGAGTLIWYSDAALTDSINNGSPFTSGATTDSTFYVTEKLAGCESPATPVVITVNPEYNIIDPAITICTGDSISIYGTFRSTAATYYDSLLTIGDGCDSVHSVVLSLDPIATVGAGVDDTICVTSTYTLSGVMGGSTSIITWTTTGDGSFSDPNSLTAIYSLGAGDIALSDITLIITTDDPAGPCGVAVDSMLLTINQLAFASTGLGGNDTTCEGTIYSLPGSIGGTATSSVWSTTGDGAFGDINNPVTTYTPGPTDISMGTVTLTITSDDPAGPCPAGTGVVNLAINQSATVSAGPDGLNCEGPIPAPMAGTMGGSATSITWTTTGSGSFSDINLLTATYTASFADVTAGSVINIITSDDPDGSGPCAAAVDSMTLTLLALDSVSVGAIICDDDSIMLGGSYQNTAGDYIDTYIGGDGCDSIVTTTLVVNPTYNTPIAQTICSNDSVILEGAYQNTAGTYMDTLTSVSGCDSVITTTLAVNAEATVNAGPDGLNCEGPIPAPMAGTMGGSATSITWTTTGSG
ncbi:MAG: PKD domain-containing protein, partial [Flavobacteriales bacterium]|nr:PKD domain-containing protein [Flavobacteriales bacterium]